MGSPKLGFHMLVKQAVVKISRPCMCDLLVPQLLIKQDPPGLIFQLPPLGRLVQQFGRLVCNRLEQDHTQAYGFLPGPAK